MFGPLMFSRYSGQVVRTSSDMATQYVSMMNCIFAAEKHVSV